MIAKTTRLLMMTAMVTGVLGFGGMGYAATVNGLIVPYLGVPDEVKVFDFSDRDVSVILQPNGAPRVGAVAVGDILLGTLGIRQISQGALQVQPGVVGDLPPVDEELTGIYLMQVTGVNPVAGGAITTGPVTQAQLIAMGFGMLQPYGFGNGVGAATNAMVGMFTGTNSPAVPANYQPSPLGGFLDVPGAIDGSFWASFGGPNGSWVITDSAAGQVFNTIAASAAAPNLQIGTFSFSLPQVLRGSSVLDFTTPLIPTPGVANALLGGGGGAPTSDLALSATALVVPLPPAVFGGMGLFGMALVMKIKRRFF